MKRPILFATIGYIIGIMIGLYWKENIVLFCIIFLVVIYILKKKCRKLNRYIKLYLKLKPILILIIFMSIAYVYTNLLEQKYQILYENVSTENSIIAKIISNVKEKQYTDCYTIEVITINENKEYSGSKLLLYITKSKDSQKYQYGDYIQFKGDYTSASKQRNYSGFDYQNYLKKDSIYGLVNTKYKNTQLIKRKASIIFSIKQSIVLHIQNMLPEDTANLLLGILLGEKEHIKEEYIDCFRKSSLAHILCVSGAHVSYIVLGITYALSKSNFHKKIKEFITILFLVFFVFITGFSPSVVRAVFMASLLLISKIFNRKIDVINSICLSLLFLLITNPFYLLDIGLLLSYGGTIGIIIFSKNVKKILNNFNPDKKYLNQIKDVLSISIAAQIIILPISVYYFNQVNLLFFVGNILATPILGAIIILGFFNLILSYVFFPISKILAIILNCLLRILIFISQISSRNSIC